MKTDIHYLTKDFWAHQYGVHLIAAAVLQVIAVFANVKFDWFKWYDFLLLSTVLHLVFWGGKEINSLVQHKWSFGLLPKSNPDWRDWRMSMYGVLLIDLIVTIINL